MTRSLLRRRPSKSVANISDWSSLLSLIRLSVDPEDRNYSSSRFRIIPKHCNLNKTTNYVQMFGNLGSLDGGSQIGYFFWGGECKCYANICECVPLKKIMQSSNP